MPHATRIKPRIGITLGDPAGIGPEITVKALKLAEIRELADFLVIGDLENFTQYGGTITQGIEFLDMKMIDPSKVKIGETQAECGKAAFAYLQKSIDLLKSREIDGLVTAPVSKEAIMLTGEHFLGHTEVLANAFGVKDFEMMFAGGPFKTIIVTRHVPLKDIPKLITQEKVLKSIQLCDQALRGLFKIQEPRIAVCGLNPHAGEGGRLGTEDIEQIVPAIAAAQKQNIHAHGPFAADTLFIPSNAKSYDMIIAMYHDQGLTPIKALYFTQLVNLTIGLPFIRTSTAHGTAFNITGKNRANASSMIEAVKMAADLTAKQLGKRRTP